MKKFLLTFILIFSLSFLWGCSQPEEVKIDNHYIMLSLDFNANGRAKQSIVFGLSSDFLRENSKSLQEELLFKQNLIKNVETLRNEFLFSFALKYMSNPIDEYKINQGVLLSQVGYNEEGDYVGFEITFTSLGAWQYYHSNGSNNESENKTKGGNIFYLKQEAKGEFPFSTTINEDQRVGEKYKDCFISAGQNLSFADKIQKTYNPQYVYNYSTYYSRLHTNADVQFKGNDKQFHHIWIEESLEDSEEIILSTFVVYKGWWILFTLIISLGCMFVSILYIKYYEKISLKKKVKI